MQPTDIRSDASLATILLGSSTISLGRNMISRFKGKNSVWRDGGISSVRDKEGVQALDTFFNGVEQSISRSLKTVVDILSKLSQGAKMVIIHMSEASCVDIVSFNG